MPWNLPIQGPRGHCPMKEFSQGPRAWPSLPQLPHYLPHQSGLVRLRPMRLTEKKSPYNNTQEQSSSIMIIGRSPARSKGTSSSSDWCCRVFPLGGAGPHPDGLPQPADSARRRCSGARSWWIFFSLNFAESNISEACCCLPIAPGTDAPLLQPSLSFPKIDNLREGERRQEKATGVPIQGGSP